MMNKGIIATIWCRLFHNKDIVKGEARIYDYVICRDIECKKCGRIDVDCKVRLDDV